MFNVKEGSFNYLNKFRRAKNFEDITTFQSIYVDKSNFIR